MSHQGEVSGRSHNVGNEKGFLGILGATEPLNFQKAARERKHQYRGLCQHRV